MSLAARVPGTQPPRPRAERRSTPRSASRSLPIARHRHDSRRGRVRRPSATPSDLRAWSPSSSRERLYWSEFDFTKRDHVDLEERGAHEGERKHRDRRIHRRIHARADDDEHVIGRARSMLRLVDEDDHVDAFDAIDGGIASRSMEESRHAAAPCACEDARTGSHASASQRAHPRWPVVTLARRSCADRGRSASARARVTHGLAGRSGGRRRWSSETR